MGNEIFYIFLQLLQNEYHRKHGFVSLNMPNIPTILGLPFIPFIIFLDIAKFYFRSYKVDIFYQHLITCKKIENKFHKIYIKNTFIFNLEIVTATPSRTIHQFPLQFSMVRKLKFPFRTLFFFQFVDIPLLHFLL